MAFFRLVRATIRDNESGCKKSTAQRYKEGKFFEGVKGDSPGGKAERGGRGHLVTFIKVGNREVTVGLCLQDGQDKVQ